MSLIEYLEGDDCEEFLRSRFQSALDVLKNDRFRIGSTAVDDLVGGLTAGGVARVRKHLEDSMEGRRFSPERKLALNNCLDQLEVENQEAIQELIADGITHDYSCHKRVA